MTRQLEATDQTEEIKSPVTIGKIDLTKFIPSSDNEDSITPKPPEEIRAGHCSNIKDHFEKSNKEEHWESGPQRKMKLIHVDVPKSTDEALTELKERNEHQQWKWKQQMIGELHKICLLYTSDAADE